MMACMNIPEIKACSSGSGQIQVFQSRRCTDKTPHLTLTKPHTDKTPQDKTPLDKTHSTTGQILTQRGQASVTLQPGAGVVKLTTIKMDKTKQFNSLSFTFLFNKLQSRMLFCLISSCIEAKCTHNCH